MDERFGATVGRAFVTSGRFWGKRAEDWGQVRIQTHLVVVMTPSGGSRGQWVGWGG